MGIGHVSRIRWALHRLRHPLHYCAASQTLIIDEYLVPTHICECGRWRYK